MMMQKKWSHIRNSIVIPNSIPFLDEKSSNCSNKSVICVGRLNEQKRFDILIEAWSLVTQEHPDWSLHIYGDGKLRSDLQKQIEKKGIKQSVILEYSVNNIQNKYLKSAFM
jgi:glycosyltransferase involved in cell wall biosynthesis